MAKFNVTDRRTPRIGGGPIVSVPDAAARTHNNAAGFTRDTESELLLLAASTFAGEETHGETGLQRNDRLADLAYIVGTENPQWLAGFVPYLRHTLNIRHASLLTAIEGSRGMIAAGHPGCRHIIDSALVRADEPEELLAYWVAHYGQKMPHGIKRGVADALPRLYTQRSVVRYDNNMSRPWTFGGVIEYVGPVAELPLQPALFKYLVSKSKHRKDLQLPETAGMLRANAELQREALKRPEVLLNTARLHLAGMRWQDVVSLAGKRLDAKAVWTAVAPTMNYMAKLRNLRNFDQAGLSADLAASIAAEIGDAHEVRRSRQLPMRFLSAYRSVVSNNWNLALEHALDASLANVPRLPGRSLILIDTSYSMNDQLSAKSTLKRWDAALLFGLALARASESADVVSFSTGNKVFPAVKGESLLRSIDRWTRNGFFLNNSTDTRRAVQDHYRGHDTVVIVTDEQANQHSGSDVVNGIVPDDKLTVTFNLAGYKTGHMPSGHSRYRVTVGGLSDAAFHLLPAFGGRTVGTWPF